MKASDLLVKCLENEEVKYVFGIVGKETLDLVHSITDSSIEFIVVRHEQSAAFMANIYGQLTRKPGVCTATLGPGATNLVTGIGAAYLDYGPVVAICGQAGLDRQHKTSHQYINLVELFNPITKWSVQVKDSATIPEIIRKAFKTAELERPGPVYIDLPENIAKESILDGVPIAKSNEPKTCANRNDVNTVKSLINASQKPFVLVGNGLVRQSGEGELLQFIEQLNAPTAHTFMAKGVLDPKHPLNFYTFGFIEKDYVVTMLRESDLIITIGFDSIEHLPENWNIDKKPILHVHSTVAEVDDFYPTKFELIGNIKENLTLLIQEELDKKEWSDLPEKRQRIKDGHNIDTYVGDHSELLLSNVINALQEVVDANTILLSDVGANKMEIARVFQPENPNHVLISNGLASMGVAVPGGIAAKLACPDQPVVCVTGDGGFLMNMPEIETAKRLNTAMIIIVLNDGMYGLEKKMMLEEQSTDEGVYFSNPDFLKLAESFGIKGYRVENTGMLKETILQELHSNNIVLIDVPVRYQ
ncbi:acetolactate synthase large subunit [Bacillus sp. DJP31]|uniref:acetolactate synthase large subunit n=1 Tax=Bacillus sp. DJP31 TaxID=3409789 RepID=UPI003BB49A27